MCHPEVPAGEVTPVVASEEVSIPLGDGVSLPALLCRPENQTGPAVIIVHDVFGRSEFYEHLAARLASAGYVALLPDLFFKEGPLPEREIELARQRRMIFDEAGSVAHVITAIDWLRNRDDVTGSVVGSVGFCMGGTIALDLAALAPNTANVCLYGFPATPAAAATNPEFRYAPPPLTIVDAMRGPILGFWGDQDHGVGMDNVRALDAALIERGVDHEFEIYPGVGHGFLAVSKLDPDSELYEKACDAWSRTIAFYRTHLS